MVLHTVLLPAPQTGPPLVSPPLNGLFADPAFWPYQSSAVIAPALLTVSPATSINPRHMAIVRFIGHAPDRLALLKTASILYRAHLMAKRRAEVRRRALVLSMEGRHRHCGYFPNRCHCALPAFDSPLHRLGQRLRLVLRPMPHSPTTTIFRVPVISASSDTRTAYHIHAAVRPGGVRVLERLPPVPPLEPWTQLSLVRSGCHGDDGLVPHSFGEVDSSPVPESPAPQLVLYERVFGSSRGSDQTVTWHSHLSERCRSRFQRLSWRVAARSSRGSEDDLRPSAWVHTTDRVRFKRAITRPHR